jgi:Phage integrase family
VSQFEGISAESVVWFGEQLEWLPATKAAELEGVRFHDLRHTAATLAVVAGATTKELIARMGHSTPDMAIRYQHIMKGRDAIVAASLDRLIQAGDGTEPGDTDMARRRRNQKERSRGRSPDQRGVAVPSAGHVPDPRTTVRLNAQVRQNFGTCRPPAEQQEQVVAAAVCGAARAGPAGL